MVELAQACSHPAIIFLLRMSCSAALILWKNHNGHRLTLSSFRSPQEGGLHVSGVMSALSF